ncbi:unnamed protein product [Blumeria hordei]|uniref:C2H2-type domain-containing protein n=1 Tax=Blumeria hordei TaxID=2867405 RepID=A0A383UUS9_BLUHO|nr:unnamed protein product [Blumeria hordei]
MPKAEVGTTKYLNNRLKSKGLQRLRWYCQVCERQMRDENGFKMHTQSESHVRQMLLVGENPKKFINDYSNQFQRDFLQLLRTSHGEKKVHMNHFYQEYIQNKEHVHMNATRWASLTEYAKHLGREGICRVEDNEKGLHIAWIDDSPENLRRQDAIRKKERQDKGDEEREKMLIQEQVLRAQIDAERRAGSGPNETENELQREEGTKIKLCFGGKPSILQAGQAKSNDESVHETEISSENPKRRFEGSAAINQELKDTLVETTQKSKLSSVNVMSKPGTSSKSKNVFAAAKKNVRSEKPPIITRPPQKMSEAERIMREEMERKNRQGPACLSGSLQKKRKL